MRNKTVKWSRTVGRCGTNWYAAHAGFGLYVSFDGTKRVWSVRDSLGSGIVVASGSSKKSVRDCQTEAILAADACVHANKIRSQYAQLGEAARGNVPSTTPYGGCP